MLVAIIGRANVGKTTIFNRLAGKKIAITHNQPGITRDRKEASVELGDMKFRICDTAGFEDMKRYDDLRSQMRQQSMYAVEEADVCLFVIDGRSGITNEDKIFFALIREKKKKYILIVNKSENEKKIVEEEELYYFNAEPVYLSAEHNLGMQDLYMALRPYYNEINQLEENVNENVIKVAVIGRPNAGKSTLINKLLGYDRLITNSVAGTTRDAISIDVTYKDKLIRIIDTAGIRRKAAIADDIEDMAVSESFRALDFASVVIMVIDVECAFEQQDILLLDRAVTEGRPIIVAFNKWDTLSEEDRKKAIKGLKARIEAVGMGDVVSSFLTLSALYDKNLNGIFDEVISLYNKWEAWISTGKLNAWLRDEEGLDRLPLIKGKKLKLKFITQYAARPPSFMISSNFAEVPEITYRTIRSKIIVHFELYGIPVRLIFKREKNPFDDTHRVLKKRYKK